MARTAREQMANLRYGKVIQTMKLQHSYAFGCRTDFRVEANGMANDISSVGSEVVDWRRLLR